MHVIHPQLWESGSGYETRGGVGDKAHEVGEHGVDHVVGRAYFLSRSARRKMPLAPLYSISAILRMAAPEWSMGTSLVPRP